MKKAKTLIKNKSGQGMVEYLIIVAIVAIGSIAIIKTVGGNINVQFANVALALGGKSGKKTAHEVTEGMYKKKDFNSFFDGAVNSKSKSDKDE